MCLGVLVVFVFFLLQFSFQNNSSLEVRRMGDGEETYSQQTQFNEKSTQRNVLFTEITNGEQTQQGKILNRFLLFL